MANARLLPLLEQGGGYTDTILLIAKSRRTIYALGRGPRREKAVNDRHGDDDEHRRKSRTHSLYG